MAIPQFAPDDADFMRRYIAGEPRDSLASHPALGAPLTLGDIQGMNDAAANQEIRDQLAPPPVQGPQAADPATQDALAALAAADARQPGYVPPQPVPAAPVAAPLPSSPAVAPKRAAGAPIASPQAPAVDLNAFLAQNYGGGAEPDPNAPPASPDDIQSDIDAEQNAAFQASEAARTATPRGLLPAQESRVLAPTKLTPQEQYELDTQSKGLAGAEDKQLSAEQDARRAQMWSQRVGAARKDEIEKDAAAKEAELTQSFQRMLAKYDDATKEMGQMDIQDPSLWTGNTGKDIVKGIGLFLLGLGAGPEAMMKEINTQIDRDLAVQRDKLAKKKQAWESEGLMLDRMGRLYDNQGAQDAAAKAVALKGVEDEMARFAQFSADPAVQARAEAGLAAARYARVAQEAELRGHFSDQVTQVSAPPKPTGTGGADELARLKKENAIRHEKGWDKELYVGPAGGYALNPEQHKVMVAAGAVAGNVMSGLTQLHKLAQDVSSAKIPATEAHAKMQAILAYTQGQLKEAEHLGALSESDYSFMDKQIPTIGLTSPNAASSYEALMERVQFGYRNQMIQSGLIDGPPPEGFRSTAKPKGFKPEEKS